MSRLKLEKIRLRATETVAGELSNKIQYECNFCSKVCDLPTQITVICERLSGEEEFYCPFCLRHQHNTKNVKHILPLSFRSVIGHYYNFLYVNKTSRIWLAEIRDYIDAHVKTGLQNPVFTYDPDTYMWYVDFSKVGNGRKKIQVEDVLKSVMEIITCFNLYKHVGPGSNRFYEKFREAIVKFHENRFRPDSRRFLIPTMNDIVASCEDTRMFIPEQLVLR